MTKSSLILEQIESPDDLKALSRKECLRLADEIRDRIVDVVSRNGGHLASNLGVVELTMALHRIFSTPEDSFVWDVGHQCYTHKILTGRNSQLDSIRRRGGISGFPKRSESFHDQMDTGHASTSISAALGLLEGKKLTGKPGKAVAVIGDGALTGGMAFEAMNHAGHLHDDLVIVLNDNDMSISRNVGALSSRPRPGRVSATISRLTIRSFYQKYKAFGDKYYGRIPLIGNLITMVRHRSKKAFKALFLKENIFGDMGFEYVGPVDGHNLKQMEKIFDRVKRLKVPVVVHVLTQKGRGYPFAEGDPASYHGVGAFNVVDGKVDKKSSLTFTECFSNIMVEAGAAHKNLVAVSAAMLKGTGLTAFGELYPERTFDVGIAEQHAVTFAAGMAAEGVKPVVAIYSTFMQRAVDQVIHDVAIPKLPIVFVMSRSGYVPDDGETHQGLYDIPMFRSVPNLQLLSPSGAADFSLLFNYALTQDEAVLIRIPKSLCSFSSRLNQPVERGRGVFVHRHRHSALLVSIGGSFEPVEEACNSLAREGVLVDHYNLRFAKPLNEKALREDFKGYDQILLIEDGAREGGVGERLVSLFEGETGCRYHHLGAPDCFQAQASRAELMEAAGLDAVSISDYLKKLMAD